MNEQQILAAMATADPKQRALLNRELIQLRASHRAATQAQSEAVVGSQAVAHLQPGTEHLRHTASTDWINQIAVDHRGDAEVRREAVTEAQRWLSTKSALVRSDPEELGTQALGYSRLWSGQFMQSATVARMAFMQRVASLITISVAPEYDELFEEDRQNREHWEHQSPAKTADVVDPTVTTEPIGLPKSPDANFNEGEWTTGGSIDQNVVIPGVTTFAERRTAGDKWRVVQDVGTPGKWVVQKWTDNWGVWGDMGDAVDTQQAAYTKMDLWQQDEAIDVDVEQRHSSKTAARAITKFMICPAHENYFAGMARYRKAEMFCEGGPGSGTPCSGGGCSFSPGTDLFEPSICETTYNTMPGSEFAWGVNAGKTASKTAGFNETGQISSYSSKTAAGNYYVQVNRLEDGSRTYKGPYLSPADAQREIDAWNQGEGSLGQRWNAVLVEGDEDFNAWQKAVKPQNKFDDPPRYFPTASRHMAAAVIGDAVSFGGSMWYVMNQTDTGRIAITPADDSGMPIDRQMGTGQWVMPDEVEVVIPRSEHPMFAHSSRIAYMSPEDWERFYHGDPISSGVPRDLFPEGGVPLHGDLTPEQQAWLDKRGSVMAGFGSQAYEQGYADGMKADWSTNPATGWNETYNGNDDYGTGFNAATDARTDRGDFKNPSTKVVGDGFVAYDDPDEFLSDFLSSRTAAEDPWLSSGADATPGNEESWTGTGEEVITDPETGWTSVTAGSEVRDDEISPDPSIQRGDRLQRNEGEFATVSYVSGNYAELSYDDGYTFRTRLSDPGDGAGPWRKVGSKTAVTYTLDAMKDGEYFEDHGLSAEQVAAAQANADRLGITIINVTEEVDVSVGDLAPFGITGSKMALYVAPSPEDAASKPWSRGELWSLTCPVCGKTETGTDYYNGWPSQNAWHNHLFCGHDPDADYHQDLAIDRYSLRTAAQDDLDWAAFKSADGWASMFIMPDGSKVIVPGRVDLYQYEADHPGAEFAMSQHHPKNASYEKPEEDVILPENTCSECGDAIEKNPGEEGYHHDNGEKHDHEAKPGSSKESAKTAASKTATSMPVVIQRGTMVFSAGPFLTKLDADQAAEYMNGLHGTNDYVSTITGAGEWYGTPQSYEEWKGIRTAAFENPPANTSTEKVVVTDNTHGIGFGWVVDDEGDKIEQDSITDDDNRYERSKDAGLRHRASDLSAIERWCDSEGVTMKDFPDELIDQAAASGDTSILGDYLDGKFDARGLTDVPFEGSLHQAEWDDTFNKDKGKMEDSTTEVVPIVGTPADDTAMFEPSDELDGHWKERNHQTPVTGRRASALDHSLFE